METEKKEVIPVDFSNPEFQKKFVNIFNLMEARITSLEKLTLPLAKQTRMNELKKELAILEEEYQKNGFSE